jgi:hypothetical protein
VNVTAIMERIEGHWSRLSPEKIRELTQWLERKHLKEDDVLYALDALVEEGLEFTPKTAQLAKKLREMGALKPPPLGVGDRGVVGRMKHDIWSGKGGVVEIHDLLGKDKGKRLQQEQWQAQALAQEDRENDLGSADYWHDRLIAYQELSDEFARGELS